MEDMKKHFRQKLYDLKEDKYNSKISFWKYFWKIDFL